MIALKELREKNKSELTKLVTQSRKDLAEIRENRSLGKLADGSEIREKRGEIARILTLVKEKEVLEKLKPEKQEEKKAPKSAVKK